MDFIRQLDSVLKTKKLIIDLDRELLIKHVVERKEAVIASNGALAIITPQDSTGRSPQDTYIVKHEESASKIDWTSQYCIPLINETFDMLLEDALKTLKTKERVYITNRYLGADPNYALCVKTITDKALTSLFTDNMFRPRPERFEKSVFSKNPFTLIALPFDKIDASKYDGRLRKTEKGKTSDMAIVMDFDRRIGLVYGSAYCGSVKKLMFTAMNYYLPGIGVLPLHCSANEGNAGDVALLLGLSGTGKTTLSADPNRQLYGDDEHGWSRDGVFNMEYGCYAKLISLNPEKEPEIFKALRHGAIIENAKLLDNGNFDFNDQTITENSRGSYPLSYLSNIKEPPVGSHPHIILFLTADAHGVLPPVSKLTREQAMLQFIMGYTCKLAGTERGIVTPVSTFSRFFGAPFMPLNPDVYAGMLGEFMDKYKTQVYMINTGWSAGPYGTGHRIDLKLTRRMVNAALEGELENVEYVEDNRFKLLVPKSCPGVPSEILDPKSTWKDKAAYEARANKLAEDFQKSFKQFSGKVSNEIAAACPRPL